METGPGGLAFLVAVVRSELFLSGDGASTERYYQSAASGARDRIKLLELDWDFVGTEYGGRQFQYEMFYSAAPPVVNRRMDRAYDWRSATDMVDRLLGEY